MENSESAYIYLYRVFRFLQSLNHSSWLGETVWQIKKFRQIAISTLGFWKRSEMVSEGTIDV